MSESTEKLNNVNVENAKSAKISNFRFDSLVFEKSRKRYGYRFIKRVFDFVFSLIVTVVLFIPMIVICTAIVLDSSGFPVFAQKRVGRFGKPIKVLKLRTMYSDAHSNPGRYFTKEQMQQWKLEYKVEKDPRITRIGSFLRKTSLDEIPQFINVLKGDMSVIGCRPITYEELENFTQEEQELFLSQKMGITGWWQVTDRNNAIWEDGSRQKVELYYVEHASLKLDAGIFCKTFRAIAKKTGK